MLIFNMVSEPGSYGHGFSVFMVYLKAIFVFLGVFYAAFIFFGFLLLPSKLFGIVMPLLEVADRKSVV